MTPDQLKSRLIGLSTTQGQIARLWEMSPATISRWASGKQPIPAWVQYALGMASLGTTPVDAAAKPTEAPKPVPAPVVAKPSTKPVQPAKPARVAVDCAPPSVPGKWRFGVFYPD